jgi:hypothetical protein
MTLRMPQPRSKLPEGGERVPERGTAVGDEPSADVKSTV